jgi:hypothetical protein
MDRACSMNGAKRNGYLGNPEKKDYYEDQDVGG